MTRNSDVLDKLFEDVKLKRSDWNPTWYSPYQARLSLVTGDTGQEPANLIWKRGSVRTRCKLESYYVRVVVATANFDNRQRIVKP